MDGAKKNNSGKENKSNTARGGVPGSVAEPPVMLYAAQMGSIPLIQRLMEAGVSVNETDHNNSSPVMVAVLNNHLDCVKFLIKKGADVNIAEVNGCTPLLIATKLHSGTTVVRTLISAGADVNMGDSKGTTPLMVAAEKIDQVALKF